MAEKKIPERPLHPLDIVKDARGNFFTFIGHRDGGMARIESVVTKETFVAPVADLTFVPGVPRA